MRLIEAKTKEMVQQKAVVPIRAQIDLRKKEEALSARPDDYFPQKEDPFQTARKEEHFGKSQEAQIQGKKGEHYKGEQWKGEQAPKGNQQPPNSKPLKYADLEDENEEKSEPFLMKPEPPGHFPKQNKQYSPLAYFQNEMEDQVPKPVRIVKGDFEEQKKEDKKCDCEARVAQNEERIRKLEEENKDLKRILGDTNKALVLLTSKFEKLNEKLGGRIGSLEMKMSQLS